LDKKTLPLVIALVLVIVFYGQILEFIGLQQPVTEPQVTTDSIGTVSEQAQQTVPVQATADTAITAPETVASDAIQSMEQDSRLPHDTIFVSTGKFDVLLSSFGGGPVSIVLKDYTLRDGSPIDMLPESEYATPELSFAGGTFSSSKVGYVCNLASGHYDLASSSLEVIYTYTAPTGGSIVKKYLFYPDTYHFDLVMEVGEREKLGFERKYSIIWNTPLGVTEPQPEADYEVMEAVAYMAESRETLDDWDDNHLNQYLAGYTDWAGVRAKYFAAIIIPRTREADGAIANGEKSSISTPDGHVEQRRITAGLDMPFASVSNITDSFTVFVGPMDYELMSDYNVGLEDMMDIGTTPVVGWIIKPFAIGIMWLLPRMYSAIPNYGLVIILFALFIKIITMPLSMKSFKSMQAMRDLQPKIDELKKKHKKNQQAVSKETMKLYKAHGVNPMSGCLPMLPQMPLFFALFSVFRSTILLRDAPFFWFINDLSRGASGPMDPYIILVVIMVGAQFVSQKLTMPSTSQNKAMGYIMPLFFGFLFYKFSAGLVLYWTMFSIFSLLDYVVFKRKKNAEIKAAIE